MKIQKKAARPLGITLLSVVEIMLGLWILLTQIQVLQTLSTPNTDLIDPEELVINIRLISSVSVASLSFIPLVLGIGLWRLMPWARIISICLSGAVMLPSLAAALELIPDPSATRQINLILGSTSAIALWILLSPSAIKAFSVSKRKKAE